MRAVALLAALAVVGTLAMPMRHDEARFLHADKTAVAVGTPPPAPLSSTATITVHESLFRKVLADVLPVIIKDARAIHIPGKKEKHFSFNPIHLSEFNIRNLTVGFNAPNKVILGLRGLTLAVPETHFDVYTHIIFKISCGGYFKVSLVDTDISLEVTVSENHDGHLEVLSVTPSVHFGALNVYHHFHSAFCRVGQDIIQLFLGNIDNLIREVVEKEMAPLMGKIVDKALVALTQKINFHLAGPPHATSNSLSFTIEFIDSQPHVAASPLAIEAPTAFPARDLEVFMTERSINDLFIDKRRKGELDFNLEIPPALFNTTSLQHLLPAAYNACRDCPILIEMNYLQAPRVDLVHEASFGFNWLVFGMNAIHPANKSHIALVDFFMNGTGVATNFSVTGRADSTVKFQIAVPVLSLALKQSNIGPVDAKSLTGIIDFVVKDVVVPTFNKKFKGITIPPIANTTITDIELAFNGAVDIGLDIDLPHH